MVEAVEVMMEPMMEPMIAGMIVGIIDSEQVVAVVLITIVCPIKLPLVYVLLPSVQLCSD